ncbi:MAG: NAD(P)/FAD-dependent oxidoreductase, partial [Mesorhizobium sp.]
MLEIAPSKQAAAWLESLARALGAGDAAAASNLFVDDCYWRDLLTFTWNITTMEGRAAIADMLAATLATTKPKAWQLTGEATSDEGTIEAWFSFETVDASGEGIMRLRDGRCWTLFTAMTDLKGFEERKGADRPLGVRHKADPKRETWSEARARETRELGADEQPYCLVIGGGQGGIMLGARLRQLGVPTIVIEKNARPGDSWRNRYRTLVLHDPVWYDHLPYIPFPENWPVFTPKDKMGDWLEMYTRVMELNYWVATKCLSASYDEAEKVWTVVVDRVGRHITLKPKHIVFATGAYGPPRRIDLPGTDQFKG